jgi:hypothetical protein
MSALTLAGIIFIMTIGGISLGALLRRTLPADHLNDQAKEAVKDCVRLIATIAALVLGLLIGDARGSFDTQNTQVKQITANLILLDSILAQYGPEALPIREHMRKVVGPFADRLWREKEVTAIGPFEASAGEEQILRISKSSRRIMMSSVHCNLAPCKSAMTSLKRGSCSSPRPHPQALQGRPVRHPCQGAAGQSL